LPLPAPLLPSSSSFSSSSWPCCAATAAAARADSTQQQHTHHTQSEVKHIFKNPCPATHQALVVAPRPCPACLARQPVPAVACLQVLGCCDGHTGGQASVMYTAGATRSTYPWVTLLHCLGGTSGTCMAPTLTLARGPDRRLKASAQLGRPACLCSRTGPTPRAGPRLPRPIAWSAWRPRRCVSTNVFSRAPPPVIQQLTLVFEALLPRPHRHPHHPHPNRPHRCHPCPQWQRLPHKESLGHELFGHLRLRLSESG
jgi:hypothetical protein